MRGILLGLALFIPVWIVIGLRIWSGTVQEEFLRELQDLRALLTIVAYAFVLVGVVAVFSTYVLALG